MRTDRTESQGKATDKPPASREHGLCARIPFVFSCYSHGVLMLLSGGPLRKPGTLKCLCNQDGFEAVWGHRSNTKSRFHDPCRPNQERRLFRFRDAHARRESARRATWPKANLALIFAPFLCPSTKPQTKRPPRPPRRPRSASPCPRNGSATRRAG